MEKRGVGVLKWQPDDDILVFEGKELLWFRELPNVAPAPEPDQLEELIQQVLHQ